MKRLASGSRFEVDNDALLYGPDYVVDVELGVEHPSRSGLETHLLTPSEARRLSIKLLDMAGLVEYTNKKRGF